MVFLHYLSGQIFYHTLWFSITVTWVFIQTAEFTRLPLPCGFCKYCLLYLERSSSPVIASFNFLKVSNIILQRRLSGYSQQSRDSVKLCLTTHYYRCIVLVCWKKIGYGIGMSHWGTWTIGQKGPSVGHRKLYPVFCDNLWEKRIWERMAMYICMTGSLCCIAEIITAL